MKISFITSSLLALFLISACQSRSMMFNELLSKADKNQTEEISWEEYLEFHMSKFSDMDTDKNGELSIKELVQMDNDMPGRFNKKDNPHKGSPLKFDRIDTDNNGSISKAEFESLGDRMFKMMDRNSDMLITAEDLEELEPPMPGGGKGDMMGRGGMGGGSRGGGMGGGPSGGMGGGMGGGFPGGL